MQYYKLDGLGNFGKEKYCFTEGLVEGVEDSSDALVYGGGSLKGEYPDDPYEVKIHLDSDRLKHIKKGDYVSNAHDYIMVSKRVVEELKKYNIGTVEYWPFTLINHKGKVHSKDYLFVVPTEQYDALNEDASDIDRDANGIVIGVDEVVLDVSKLKGAPDMFRVNDLGVTAFSEPLAEKLEQDFANFVFDEFEQE